MWGKSAGGSPVFWVGLEGLEKLGPGISISWVLHVVGNSLGPVCGPQGCNREYEKIRKMDPGMIWCPPLVGDLAAPWATVWSASSAAFGVLWWWQRLTHSDQSPGKHGKTDPAQSPHFFLGQIITGPALGPLHQRVCSELGRRGLRLEMLGLHPCRALAFRKRLA